MTPTCSGTKKETYIQSPNYPNKYPANKDCSWTIKALPGRNIKLMISHFDVDYKDYDCNDYVEIFDVVNGNEVKLGKFCNNRKPPESILSSGNELKVEFHSSRSYQGKGFRFDYRSLEPGIIL